MRAIVVDDEPIMLGAFMRLTSDISDLDVVGQFTDPTEALRFVEKNPVALAFLDVRMPQMDGIALAEELRELLPDIVIVFVTAYDEYIRESNRIGGDYYIVKPYETQTLETAMERIRLIAQRQRKSVYIRTFGSFTVLVDGKPIALRGRAKEILALLVARRGKEVSNEQIYSTIWENRSYSNANMTVYYNALRRLKDSLQQAGLGDLLVSSAHGQMVDTSLFDCDYYDWLAGGSSSNEGFEGEFLSEYSWAEPHLASIMRIAYERE